MSKNDSRGHSNTPALCTTSLSSQNARLKILIDWVGFTLNPDVARLDTVLNFFRDHLFIEKSFWENGRRNYEGYAQSLVYENINIYYNGAENQGIHVDITGQGCRFIDIQMQKLRVQEGIIIDWYEILELIHEDINYKFTRIDIACDDYVGYLNVEELFQKSLKGELTMKFRSWSPDGKFKSNGLSNGISLYYGSDDSRFQVVFYEKNKQLKLDYHWTRCELRFRKQRANEFVRDVLKSKSMPIGVIAGGILKEYITFREKHETDSNVRRWEESPFWLNFLSGIPKLKIASQRPDRNIVKSRKHLQDQWSRTIARLYFAYQDINDKWLEEILWDGYDKLNAEDKRQIEEFRRMYKTEKEILKIKNDTPL